MLVILLGRSHLNLERIWQSPRMDKDLLEERALEREKVSD